MTRIIKPYPAPSRRGLLTGVMALAAFAALPKDASAQLLTLGAGKGGATGGGGGGFLWDTGVRTSGVLTAVGDTQALVSSAVVGAIRGVDSRSSGTPTWNFKIDNFIGGGTMWIGLENATAGHASGTWAGGESVNRMGLYIDVGSVWRPDGGGGNSNLANQPSLVAVTNDILHIQPNFTAGTCDIWVNSGTPYTVDHIPTGALYAVAGFESGSGNAVTLQSIT